ncbi:MAG TPA: thiamine phosphate synthase [Acetobacteraceae bacterium]|nr:thiamine phosphate synthase [Acetobacteraceae bacterium]
MDPRLLSWAHATAARFHSKVPPLWLFTDSLRLPDPRPAARRLPRGLAGIVLRHDDAVDRAALGRELACICRARRLALVVAGDPSLAATLHAGIHLRAGRRTGPIRSYRRLVTSSAHNAIELRRAVRAGAALIFLSPAFPTLSHPGAADLGALRWTRLARLAYPRVAALGGIDGTSIGRLPRHFCRAIGAIGALV